MSFNTAAGEWKHHQTKTHGNITIPVDKTAKESAELQFNKWIYVHYNDEFCKLYLEHSKGVKYSHETDVAMLVYDLYNAREGLVHDPIGPQSPRKQLESRGIDHRSLPHWRLMAALEVAQRIIGSKITD